MCSHFTQAYTWQELVALYRLTVPATNLQPRYNIAPTTTIDAIIARGADHLAQTPMRWGLIPHWWKKTVKEVPSTFNAGAETVAEKPMFRTAFKRSRCVIQASGYYEWKPTTSGKYASQSVARPSASLWHHGATGRQRRASSSVIKVQRSGHHSFIKASRRCHDAPLFSTMGREKREGREMQLHEYRAKLSAIRAFATPARCPNCGDLMVAPIASEFIEGGEIRHHWECDTCGEPSSTSIPLMSY